MKSAFPRPRLVSSRPAGSGRDASAEFRRVILPHLDGAYNVARYLCGDPVLSEDIVQDAIVRAFRGYGQFRDESPRAWLYAIVRNCCRTAQANRAGLMSLVVHESGLNEEDKLKLEREADPSPSPEDNAIRAGEIEELRTAIDDMPEPFREVIVLRELEGCSYAEIAQITAVPIGTVMSRLARGRSILARKLLPEAAAEEPTRSAK